MSNVADLNSSCSVALFIYLFLTEVVSAVT